MSAMLYEVRERFFLHVLLFIYNGSAIFYHLRMWNSAGGQAPIWFAKADTFWFNVYALIASSIANAIGVIASYLKMTQQWGKAVAKARINLLLIHTGHVGHVFL